MRGPRVVWRPIACALAPMLLGLACARTTYEGVDVSEYVPEEHLGKVMTALELAGDNGDQILAAITGAPGDDRESLADKAKSMGFKVIEVAREGKPDLIFIHDRDGNGFEIK